MQTLQEWRERCSDQPVCFMVLRLEHLKIVWLTAGKKWTKKQQDGLCWSDRQAAYAEAQEAHGLLYMYDR